MRWRFARGTTPRDMTQMGPLAHRGRLLATLRVQYPDTIDTRGGYRLLHPETGDPYTDHRRHLVATCRSVVNAALGVIADGPSWCFDAAVHGISFIERAHRVSEGSDAGNDAGYELVVTTDGDPIDRTRSAYGHAFVLLAFARAVAAGVDGAKARLEATVDLLDHRFHDGTGCLRSDCDTAWTDLEAYRGQNANMHACEAYLAAYEATGNETYLDRAARIAERITVDLAAETDGLLWEHYTADWTHDFAYNEDEPRHQFRPPGYQPGHHVEWAKFLALLDRYDAAFPPSLAEAGWYGRAVELFDAAIDTGWTEAGFAYTVDGDGSVIVGDRYGWVIAEAIGATAALTERARDRNEASDVTRFRNWHSQLFDCVDAYRGPAGLWYESLPAAGDTGSPVSPEPPGVEPEYHPATAFFESWRSGRR